MNKLRKRGCRLTAAAPLARIISPLVIAVALEVVVRPNAATPVAVLHDLDKIVRDYLLPRIIPSFSTVTDHRWTVDFAELR
jgi:hypothetical protein